MQAGDVSISSSALVPGALPAQPLALRSLDGCVLQPPWDVGGEAVPW